MSAAPWTFEAIGTVWRITCAAPLEAGTQARVLDRIRRYDAAFSRFRPDSLVSRHAVQGGPMRYPAEAAALFDLYDRVGALTEGRVTPLVGASLERLGYDAAYRLRPSDAPLVPPGRDAMSVHGATVTLQAPALLDIGAAGKGQLVDLVAEVLAADGHRDSTVDAGGDVRYAGAGLRVGLEHPHDPTSAIGVVTLRGDRCAIAGSATNRRRWGDGWHHVLDGTTGEPVRSVVATWALASSAMVADLLATALFFVPGERIEGEFDADWVRVFADGRFEASATLPGELFTS